jgi:hypothetical protein
MRTYLVRKSLSKVKIFQIQLADMIVAFYFGISFAPFSKLILDFIDNYHIKLIFLPAINTIYAIGVFEFQPYR